MHAVKASGRAIYLTTTVRVRWSERTKERGSSSRGRRGQHRLKKCSVRRPFVHTSPSPSRSTCAGMHAWTQLRARTNAGPGLQGRRTYYVHGPGARGHNSRSRSELGRVSSRSRRRIRVQRPPGRRQGHGTAAGARVAVCPGSPGLLLPSD